MSNYWIRRATSRRGVLRGSALGAAGLAAAAAVGCGDDDSGAKKTATSAASGATSAATGATTAGGTAAAKATPKQGGTLTYVQIPAAGDPPTFDVHTVTGNLTRVPAGFVYSRLLGHKSAPGVNYQAPPIETDLAASYEVADNGTTLIFKLRQGVKFQAPVSREMKAADVVFSYKRYTGQVPPVKAAPNASRFLNYVDSVTATDDYTVVVKAKQPYFPLVDAFASGSYLFVYPTEAGTAYDPAVKMVGTGPFILDSFRPGQGHTFVPNKDWFRIKERPIYFDKVELPFMAVEQRDTQFLGKNVDVMSQVPGASLVKIRKAIPEVQYWGSPVGASSLGFSVKDTRLKDPRVRQALSMALDRDGINDTLFGLKELKAAGLQAETAWMNFVSPRNKDEFLDPKGKDIKPENAKLFTQNIAEAKKLLSAAGFPNGFDMKVAVTPAYGEPYRTEAELIAQMFTAMGVKTTVDTQDYASQYIKTYLGDFDSGAVILSDGQSDPADYIELWFQSSSVRNTSKVNDPEVDRMLAAIQTNFNTQERATKLKDMQQYLDDKMYNVPIQSSGGSTWIVAQPYVQNARDYAQSPSPYSYGFASDGLPYWWKSA